MFFRDGRLLLFLFFLNSLCVKESTKDSITTVNTPGPAHVHVHVHNNNMQSQQVENYPKFYNAWIKIKNFITPENFAFEDLTPDMLKKVFDQRTLSIRYFARDYYKKNKYRLLAGGLALVYGSAWLKIIYYYNFIMNHGGWASWKESIPVEMLKVIPQQELGKDLLFSVQQKYQRATTLHDFFLPLIAFLNDVEYELSVITNFLKMSRFMRVTKLSLIFPLHEKIVEKAYEKAERLTYLKDVFLYWVTDYKIAINGQS